MEFYKNDFIISKKIGNNAFSYEKRDQKEIIIPKCIETENIKIPETNEFPGFVEYLEEEHICYGLKNFNKFYIDNKPCYLFDNHNHAFFFSIYEIEQNKLNKPDFVHIDQHKDMRLPEMTFHEYIDWKKSVNLEEYAPNIYSSYNIENPLSDYYEYGNLILNVGNYIKPLQDLNYINSILIVDSSYALKNIQNNISDNYILNIDLDFFSQDMDYINYEEKIYIIKNLIKKAKLILFATSPFFINRNRWEKALKSIIYECDF